MNIPCKVQTGGGGGGQGERKSFISLLSLTRIKTSPSRGPNLIIPDFCGPQKANSDNQAAQKSWEKSEGPPGTFAWVT